MENPIKASVQAPARPSDLLGAGAFLHKQDDNHKRRAHVVGDLPKVLAVDAATNLGWGFGRPGESPASGSLRCAGKEASRAAVFAGAGRWLTRFILDNRPDAIFIEAPVATSHFMGATNARTTAILFGMPAVLEFSGFIQGVFELHRVEVKDVRKHFIGRNAKGEIAKPLVSKKCFALGWVGRDDTDTSFDRTDALAVWSYACHQIAPKLAQPVDDLFVKAEQRRREAEERAAAEAAKPSLFMEQF